jgi:ferrous iron transport protein B
MAYCIALMVYQIGGLILGVVSFGVGTVVAFIILAVVLFLLFRPDPSKKVKKSN